MPYTETVPPPGGGGYWLRDVAREREARPNLAWREHGDLAPIGQEEIEVDGQFAVEVAPRGGNVCHCDLDHFRTFFGFALTGAHQRRPYRRTRGAAISRTP